jgi:hypothetical protein
MVGCGVKFVQLSRNISPEGVYYVDLSRGLSAQCTYVYSSPPSCTVSGEEFCLTPI